MRRRRDTSVSLREYVDQRFDDNDRIYDERQAASRIEVAGLASQIELQRRDLDRAEGRRQVLTVLVSAATSLVVALIVGVSVYWLTHK